MKAIPNRPGPFWDAIEGRAPVPRADVDPHAHLDHRRSRGGLAKSWLKGRVAYALGRLAAACLTPRALEFPSVRTQLWSRGIAAQPKGFYASLVDPADLSDGVVSPCHGVDLNQQSHEHLLRTVFPKYQREYAALPRERAEGWESSPRFYLRNDAFVNIDALAYWAMIREYRPARVVELGSGFSTLLAAQAVATNGVGGVTAIDPFPRAFIRHNDLGINLIRQPAELMRADELLSLAANDIVFVDSTHVVRQGGDVLWFFHDILPRLNPGVLVHVHDVHLPFDYPVELILSRNVYWTEQYLLRSHLTKNVTDRVLFGSRYAAHAFPDDTREAFPALDKVDGASFWFQVG